MKPEDVLSQLVDNWLYSGGCQMYQDETEHEPINDFEEEQEMYEDD